MDNRLTRKRLVFLLFVSVIGFGVTFGNRITLDEQISLIEGVKNSAAILFGVVAAWMALVYPEELKNVLKEADKPQKSARLFKAFYIASVSLLLAICFPACVRIAEKVGPVSLKPLVNRFGFGLVLATVLLQVWVLYLVAVSTEFLRRDGLIAKRKTEAVARLLHRKK